MAKDRSIPGLPPRVLKASAGTLRAIAHPARLKIIELLIGAERTVSDLVELLKLPQHTVSRHLRELRAARVVSARRAGRHVHYRLISADAATIVQAVHRNHFRTANFTDGAAI